MNQTTFNRSKKGHYLHRLPVSALNIVLATDCGFVAWCPLNQRWAAAPFGHGYNLYPTLRRALDRIQWYHKQQRITRQVFPTIHRQKPRHIGDLMYSIESSTELFRAVELKYDPQAIFPLWQGR